ncbi:MAG: phosphoribosylamine--glycine ligase [Calditrichaeota bacterium]|nr:MAG: phosphoribosylamine--glycine ligase [Calditrichota bacterium]
MESQSMKVMVFGVGGFAQGVLHILKEHGAQVSTYLTRNYARHSPALEGDTFLPEVHPNPVSLAKEKGVDLIIPMSIDWTLMDWAQELLADAVPILSPVGEGIRLERERDFARKLCGDFGIPFPKAFVATNRLEAEKILDAHPAAYVIKNPLCSPTSPIHTILCETEEDTRSWLKRVNYEEGVFLQEYMGTREAGHIALVSGGEIYSLITNQEYKRAFDGNMGIVAGAPLGGLVERDPEDKYGLAAELLHPLLPWFRKVGFHGPVQVTAIRVDDHWSVLEYNVRIGITSGPILLRMLKDPLRVLADCVADRKLEVEFNPGMNCGCSLTLAGYGYPYVEVTGPKLPVSVQGPLDCDVWWNEIEVDRNGGFYAAGHRIADVVAVRPTLEEAIECAYANMRRIRCLGSYYRTDIGQSLWPPGNA